MTKCYKHVLYKRRREKEKQYSDGWNNSSSFPTKNSQRQEAGRNEGRRKTGVTPRILRERPRAAEAARRKIHGRRRWHCDYAKNLLPAELRWTDTLEGASDASHPQLCSYATLARGTSLAPRYCYHRACPKCRRCRRGRRRRGRGRRHRHVHHRHPVVRGTAITQQYAVRHRKTR